MFSSNLTLRKYIWCCHPLANTYLFVPVLDKKKKRKKKVCGGDWFVFWIHGKDPNGKKKKKKSKNTGGSFGQVNASLTKGSADVPLY